MSQSDRRNMRRQADRIELAIKGIAVFALAAILVSVTGCRTQDGKTVSPESAGRLAIDSIAYSADGKRLYFVEEAATSGFENIEYSLYSVKTDMTDRRLIKERIKLSKSTIAPSPNGKYIAVLDDPKVLIIALKDNSVYRTISDGKIKAFSWGETSSRLLYTTGLGSTKTMSTAPNGGQQALEGTIRTFLFDLATSKKTVVEDGMGLDCSEAKGYVACTTCGCRYGYNELRIVDVKTGKPTSLTQSDSGVFEHVELAADAIYYALNLKTDNSSEIGMVDLATGSKQVIWQGIGQENEVIGVRKMILDAKRGLLIFRESDYGTGFSGTLSAITLSDNSIKRIAERTTSSWDYNPRTGNAIIVENSGAKPKEIEID